MRDVSARDETARYGDARGKVRGKCGKAWGKRVPAKACARVDAHAQAARAACEPTAARQWRRISEGGSAAANQWWRQ
ncbi:hypothetical protein DP43_4901 [Burkholderia pseudomallei]|nr:hypothetical protein DP43_4901 [Burkholderia pseudomallei]